MNLTILALLRNPVLSRLIEAHFKESLGLKPIIKKSIDEAICFLEMLRKAELVIVDSQFSDVEIDLLVQLFKSGRVQIKQLVIFGEREVKISGPEIKVLKSKIEISDFLNHHFNFKEAERTFVSVPVGLLRHFRILPFDLYLKLSGTRFVKRFKAGEEIEKAVLTALKIRGVGEIYFEKKHNKDFTGILLNNMLNGLEREHETFESKLNSDNDVFLTTKEIVQTLGVPARVVRVCEGVMKNILEDVKKGKNHFAQYVEYLKRPEFDFHYRFIELSSYFATYLAEGSSSFSSVDHSRIVIFASMFSDLQLRSPDLIHIRTPEQLNASSADDYKEVNDHAYQAAELVLKYQNAPEGAAKIIRQHHGTPNGIGFSENYYDVICPLSKGLIVSQKLAYEILINPDVSSGKILDEVKRKHAGSSLGEMLSMFNLSLKAS